MRWFHLKNNIGYRPTLNLSKLWTLVSEDVRAKAASATDGKAPVIDVTKAGFYKVLGHGSLPNVPVIVKAKFFTKLAEKKVKSVMGGQMGYDCEELTLRLRLVSSKKTQIKELHELINWRQTDQLVLQSTLTKLQREQLKTRAGMRAGIIAVARSPRSAVRGSDPARQPVEVRISSRVPFSAPAHFL